jgi:class 3 adenylate cyclase/ActR/RegA family two-component response regulator
MGARTLTVLFTDLVGSTSAWSGMDRAAADRRRSRHFALMRAAIAESGGREAKSLGDGLMAGFESVGAALTCAGAMQRSFDAGRRGGEAMLGLRVGLCTGDVTSEEGDVFGVPVIAASRLCALAEAGQVLLPAATRELLGPDPGHSFRDVGVLELKGLTEPVRAVELAWEEAGGATTRVVLADDATLVRAGLARLLESEGIEVVAQVGDAAGALAAIATERPHAVVLDIRMPPDHRVEGLEAAEEILAGGTGIGVLLLSTHLELEYAKRLMAAGSGHGVGYLAKERVVDVEEFAAAIRRVAAGGTAFDPELSGALSRGTSVDES